MDTRKSVVESTTITTDTHQITCQRELRACGKSACRRCPHGPYWYAYWKQGGQTRSCYIGRDLTQAKARAAVTRAKTR